jgi:hypothetical protein
VKPLFTHGHVVATPGALAAIEKPGQQPEDFLARHVSGDLGEVPRHKRGGGKLASGLPPSIDVDALKWGPKVYGIGDQPLSCDLQVVLAP